MKNKRFNINIRIILLYFSLVLVAFSIILKILYVQEAETIVTDYNEPKFFEVEAPRGNIFADDGSLLAISMPLYDLHLDMTVMDNQIFDQKVEKLSIGIAEIFGDMNALSIQAELESAKRANKQYYLLKNKVTHNELNLLKKLPIFNLGRNKGGLISEIRPNREKPFGILAKRTIGILREANPVGIERAFNQALSGVNGIQLKQKVGRNKWMPKDSEVNKLPIAGNDVVTTINTDMQDVAEDALHKALIRHNASWGCVILMEVETGHVKVIANLKKNEDSLVDERYNYAIAQHSEPGSTFKLASLIAGLEDGYFDVGDSIDTEKGVYKFYTESMRDSKKGGYGIISIGEAFVKSSNIGISKIINESYKENPNNFIDRIYKMGLSTPLDLELPFPNNLLIKTPQTEGWSGISLPWMSIGYEMQITPIHMLTFYNAIANNGKMVKPIFTSKIIKEDRLLMDRNTILINPSICSQSTINKVIPLLEAVVQRGTAKGIYSEQYQIAGKTGTTVLDYSRDNQDSFERRYQTSFVGFFPARRPKYSCIVVVNDPRGDFHYGGDVAAPVFREISDKVFAFDVEMHDDLEQFDYSPSLPKIKHGNRLDAEKVLSYFNIPNESGSSDWMIATESEDKILLEVRKIVNDLQNGVMPELTGMGLKDAIYLLENHGLKVSFSGNGAIKEQSIKKGEIFSKGNLIKLVLA